LASSTAMPGHTTSRISFSVTNWPRRSIKRASRARARTERHRLGDTRAVHAKQTTAGAIEAKAFEHENLRRTEPIYVLSPRQLRPLFNGQVSSHPSACCVSQFTQCRNIRQYPSTDRAPAQPARSAQMTLTTLTSALWKFLDRFGSFLDRPLSPRSIGVPINPDDFEAGTEM
jgi:hypothetical protein